MCSGTIASQLSSHWHPALEPCPRPGLCWAPSKAPCSGVSSLWPRSTAAVVWLHLWPQRRSHAEHELWTCGTRVRWLLRGGGGRSEAGSGECAVEHLQAALPRAGVPCTSGSAGVAACGAAVAETPAGPQLSLRTAHTRSQPFRHSSPWLHAIAWCGWRPRRMA